MRLDWKYFKNRILGTTYRIRVGWRIRATERECNRLRKEREKE